MTETERLSDAATALLYWYPTAARKLPWREDPTPYHVWISEIMLQQTRVEAVKPYYARFLEVLPTPAALAEVSDDALNKLWQGLGYYTRARNLKKAAQVIVRDHGGELPRTYAELRALPGVGAYTAGAIASIAMGLPEPAVDGNVLRVVTRVLSDGADILKQTTKDRITALLRNVYPKIPEDARTLTQALMELGATVCAPNGAPHCDTCPLADLCTAHKEGRETEFPKKTPKKARVIEERTVFLLVSDGRYAIGKRPERGLLAGLWEFPSADGVLSGKEALLWAEKNGFSPAGEPEKLPQAVHIFTHREWHMTGWRIPTASIPEPYVSASREEIYDTYCIPSALRAYRMML